MSSFFYCWPAILWFFGLIEFLIQILRHVPTINGFGFLGAVAVLGVISFKQRHVFQKSFFELFSEWKVSPLFFKFLAFISILILFLAAVESLHPPHLNQEFDALNYHMGLARQHLLQSNFTPLSWSSADLWPMAIQWGFAATWFMGKTINRVPQFFCALWVFFLILNLGRRQFADWRGWVPALAFITTHGVVIQLGIAMLDLVNLYFFILGVYCFIVKRPILSGAFFAIYCTGKTFYIFQFFFLVGLLGLFTFIFQKPAFDLKAELKKAALAFALSFAVLMAHSAVVSVERAGTPLFPFFTCAYKSAPGCQGQGEVSIRRSSENMISAKNNYGSGIGIKSFVLHLWRVAVPTAGVNNEYDYPLGLAWLLLVIFVIYGYAGWVKARMASPYVILAIGFWICWWFGSQQARWLYPVMAFGWLGTLEIQSRVWPKILLGALGISAAFSLTSEWRAFRSTLFMSSLEIQRQQEAKLEWSPQTGYLSSTELLFVDKPVVKHAPGNDTWILR